MKKIVIFIGVTIAIVSAISYLYITYRINNSEIQQANQLFESYYQRQVYGRELATAINKAIDNNDKNDVDKDENNQYIENETNSIKINIKMLDDEKTYPMEVFADSGIREFMEYYNSIQFKCTDIQYHENTKLVKSLLFEQVTV